MFQGHHDTGAIAAICETHGRRRDRLMDIVVDVHHRYGRVDGTLMDDIATELGVPRVDVESIISFYSFLDTRPRGQFIIRLCNDLIDRLKGADQIAAELERVLDIRMGESSRDGLFTLEWTPFIGMADQAPAAMINDVVVTNLRPQDISPMIDELREHRDAQRLVKTCGDGNNAHPLVRAMVRNSVHRSGEVLLCESPRDAGLKNALQQKPEDVIEAVKSSGLQGRGGAGFSTGLKWEFTKAAEGGDRWVICNADEGEPGTFKDRVLLTERAEMLIEGMTIAGYAIDTHQGLIYLRAEYSYLRRYLQDIIDERRRRGLLGKNVLGHENFKFDIVIRMGAGAYICGEETSLISSVEGQRADPKLRPPFPAQKGYLASPTSVNNVETLCCVPRILDRGPAWFAAIGTGKSKGTKLFSVSGDCARPGVFELSFGTTLGKLLDLAGAEDVHAVQVGGPSGQMVNRDALGRELSFEDLNGGGSIMVFDSTRDVIDIAHQFTGFFADESCGHCTPCRVGNVLMAQRLDNILKGRGRSKDLEYIERLSTTMKTASRCGLGQTASSPAVTSLRAFPDYWDAAVESGNGTLIPSFSIKDALRPAEKIAGRASVKDWTTEEVES